MKKIVVNPELCSGCEMCALICSFVNTGGFNPHRACLSINHFQDGVFNSPAFCQQCEDAVCVKVCPTSALEIDKEKGYVSLDTEKCIGCGECEENCPFDMITIDPDSKKAFKCQLCDGQTYCVDYCPEDALGVYEK